MSNTRSIGILTGLKLVAAVLSIIYSILQANLFGTDRDIEIYFGATAITAVMFSLSQSGVLAEIFLPIYHRIKAEHGIELATKSFSVIVNHIATFVLFICISSYFLAPFLIGLILPGFDEESQTKAIQVFRVTCFLLLPQVLNAFFTVILNAEKIYGRTELIGLARSLINLLVLIFTFKYLGVWSLVLSLCIGQCLALIIYIFLYYKSHFKLHFIWSVPHFDHKDFFKNLSNTLLYVGGTQFYSIILNSLVSLLPQGYYAIFNYVQALYTKTRGIITQPMITVFFTNFSIAVNSGKEKLVKMIKEYTSFAFLICSVVIIFAVVLGENAIRILWGSDKFEEHLIGPAAQLLVFNYIALLITSIGNIFRKIAITKNKAGVAYRGWTIAQFATAGFTYLLINMLAEDGLKWVFLINVLLLGSVSWIITYSVDKELSFAFSWRNILKILAITFILIPIGIVLCNNLSSWALFENKRISLFIVTLLIAFILGSGVIVLGYLMKVDKFSTIPARVNTLYSKSKRKINSKKS